MQLSGKNRALSSGSVDSESCASFQVLMCQRLLKLPWLMTSSHYNLLWVNKRVMLEAIIRTFMQSKWQMLYISITSCFFLYYMFTVLDLLQAQQGDPTLTWPAWSFYHSLSNEVSLEPSLCVLRVLHFWCWTHQEKFGWLHKVWFHQHAIVCLVLSLPAFYVVALCII